MAGFPWIKLDVRLYIKTYASDGCERQCYGIIVIEGNDIIRLLPRFGHFRFLEVFHTSYDFMYYVV